MATTGHENESINVGGLKSSLQALKTKYIDNLDSRTDILEEAVGSGGSIDTRIENAINALDSTKSQSAGTDGLALSITETDGKITAINGSIVANTYDAYGAASQAQTAAATAISNEVIARTNAVSAEATRARTAESALQNNIEALTQSNIVVVADHTSVSSPDPLTIYREQGTNTYSDWMYQNGSWNKMAEYDNAIDDEPTIGSNNLVKSGGILDKINQIGYNITWNCFFNDYVKWPYNTQANWYIKIPEGFDFSKVVTLKITSKSSTFPLDGILYVYAAASKDDSDLGRVAEIHINGNAIDTSIIPINAKYLWIVRGGVNNVADIILKIEVTQGESYTQSLYTNKQYSFQQTWSSSTLNFVIPLTEMNFSKDLPMSITPMSSVEYSAYISVMFIDTLTPDRDTGAIEGYSKNCYFGDTVTFDDVPDEALAVWIVRGISPTQTTQLSATIECDSIIGNIEKRLSRLEGASPSGYPDFIDAYNLTHGGIISGEYTLNGVLTMNEGETIIGNNLIINVRDGAQIVMKSNCRIEGVAFVGNWNINRTPAETESGINAIWTKEQLEDYETISSLIVGLNIPLIVTQQNNCFNATIQNCSFDKIGKACISLYGDSIRHYGKNQPKVCGCYFSNSLSAIILTTDTSEFTIIESCRVDNCLMGIYIYAGNINISSCILKRCDCALYFYDSHNGLHGEVTGVQIAHCPLNGIYFNGGRDILGELFCGLHIADASIEGVNVYGVIFNGCKLETWFDVPTGGKWIINGCIMRSSYADAYGKTWLILPPDTLMKSNRRLPNNTDDSTVNN